MSLSYTDWIAVYAGLVATAALTLEVRRWVESGPHLKLSVSPVMKLFEGGAVCDEEFLFATVVNRGSLPTSIEAMALLSFRSWFDRVVRFRNYWSAIILRPYPDLPLPHVLHPGQIWKGGVIYDEELQTKLQKQSIFVAIYVSHRSRPLLKQIVLQDLASQVQPD